MTRPCPRLLVVPLVALFAPLVLFTLVPAAGCGDDDTEADRLGVGAQCAETADCDDTENLECLTQFKGGYCGLAGCQHDDDCPEASACILHDDGMNYCFRICADKPECNEHRDLENEANCSSTAEFVDGANGRKACVPPSSGT
jgi:hypothetical protein